MSRDVSWTLAMPCTFSTAPDAFCRLSRSGISPSLAAVSRATRPSVAGAAFSRKGERPRAPSETAEAVEITNERRFMGKNEWKDQLHRATAPPNRARPPCRMAALPGMRLEVDGRGQNEESRIDDAK